MQINSTSTMTQMHTQKMDGSGKGNGMREVMQSLSDEDQTFVREQMRSMSSEDRQSFKTNIMSMDSTALTSFLESLRSVPSVSQTSLDVYA